MLCALLSEMERGEETGALLSEIGRGEETGAQLSETRRGEETGALLNETGRGEETGALLNETERGEETGEMTSRVGVSFRVALCKSNLSRSVSVFCNCFLSLVGGASQKEGSLLLWLSVCRKYSSTLPSIFFSFKEQHFLTCLVQFETSS